ncbi:MAG: O-antigen ligase family protein [Bacteroidota bacterium]|nr:O-antigen ligase family protein [Bacteroidota bacterium]MDP4234697.1 O-antigen ligase family protein [Bacteroidota bacterium]MDP4243921.1 O-antigen ligase family protein [Bacteroidota bacterium]MDP4288857.1 O-antigen ligase family protein [Bacteroidota bacterium]
MTTLDKGLEWGAQQSREIFTFRNLKYLVCWLMLWQDSMIGGSILELSTIFGEIPGTRTVEVFAMLLALIAICERTLSGDFKLRRSYFSAPLILILVIFFFSWCRGQIMLQRFNPVLEAHDAFAWPFAFFIVINAFRDDEDRRALWRIIMLAVIPKAVEGVYIYFFTPPNSGKDWGVVQLWRDAYLLGIGSVSLMLFAHYRGTTLRWIKWALYLSTPFLGFTFIMSMRRTFLVSALAAAALMFFTLPKERRRRHLAVASGFLGFMIFFTLITDPMALIGRLSGIVAPQNEGSAYIRLMEWPNVLLNIWHHPLLGVPVGVPWKTYYRMPVSAVYTTLGTHNTYLYWPLRAGILGAVAFFWLLGKLWKTALINNRLRRTEDDFIFGQLAIHLLILYQVSCFFGLMYAEDLPVFMAVVMTTFQLQSKYISGRYSYSEVSLRETLRAGKLVFTPRAIRRASRQKVTSILPVTV